MRVIHKFQIVPADVDIARVALIAERLEVPAGKVVHVGVQRGWPCAWIERETLVGTTNDTLTQEIVLVGTGHEFDLGDAEYIDTIQLFAGDLVLHAYVRQL